MAGALLAQDRQGGLGDVDDAEEVRVDLGAEVLGGDVLDRGEVGVAGVVDDDVEAAERLDRRPHGGLGGGRVGDVEGHLAEPVAVRVDEVVEQLGVSRGGDERMAGFEDRLGDRRGRGRGRYR